MTSLLAHARKTVELMCSADETPVAVEIERAASRQIVSARCQSPRSDSSDDYFAYYAVAFGGALVQITGASQGSASSAQRTIEELIGTVSDDA
jgi:hypothetical protein